MKWYKFPLCSKCRKTGDTSTSRISHIKGDEMKIKVFMPTGYKIVQIVVSDDIKKIADKFERWEYVL